MAVLSDASGGLAGKTFTFTAIAEDPTDSWGSCCKKAADFGAACLASAAIQIMQAENKETMQRTALCETQCQQAQGH